VIRLGDAKMYLKKKRGLGKNRETYRRSHRLRALPGMVRKEAHTLTFAQAKDLLATMQYPEKE
jgi:hypothetical protein